MLRKKLEFPGIGHIGMVVGSLKECTEKFTAVFGIDNFLIYDFQPKRVWVMGREIYDCKFKIAMATLENGSQLEIIEAVSGDTPHKDFILSGGQGIHHIAFYTDKYDDWLDYFKGMNAAILFEAEVEDEVKGYRRCFYAEDRELCSIIEVTEKSIFNQDLGGIEPHSILG
jgi:Glyoxalase/Bleomycin resistance protein/Dioxygenase superfamily.